MNEKEKQSVIWKRRVVTMDDHYIRYLIKREYKITNEDVTPLMIKQKRKDLKIKRKRWGREYV